GQGGLGHVNEQPLEYWVKKFWTRGYVPLEVLRPFIGGDQTLYPWLLQNLVMFISYELLLRSEALRRFARPLRDFSLKYPLSANVYDREAAMALRADAFRLRDSGKQIEAEELFIQGMNRYPGILDNYGEPTFHKELIRMLLSHRQWDRAKEMIPTSVAPGGTSWHEILFGRAYAQAGDDTEAAWWWSRVRARESDSSEAKAFFAGRLRSAED
ncbi:MAG: hypothetical protein WBD95_22335, partial [Xanthobacteraceae bacterium]